MKTSRFLPALAIASSLAGASLSAEEPEAIRLMPEIQALLGQLRDSADGGSAQGATRDGNSQGTKLSPEMQARIMELLKGASQAQQPADNGSGQAAQLPPAIQALVAQLLKSTATGQADGGGHGGDAELEKLLPAAMQALVAQLNEAKGATANPAAANPDTGNSQDAQTAKTLAGIQALLGALLKGDASPQDASPQAAQPAAPTTAAQSPVKKAPQTGLQTHSLTTSSLKPSGTLDGTPRLTGEEWRQLFPGK